MTRACTPRLAELFSTTTGRAGRDGEVLGAAEPVPAQPRMGPAVHAWARNNRRKPNRQAPCPTRFSLIGSGLGDPTPAHSGDCVTTIAWSGGKSLEARSPSPKKTSVIWRPVSLCVRGYFAVVLRCTKLSAWRRAIVLKSASTRGSARRGGEDRHRHRLVDRGFDRPPPFRNRTRPTTCETTSSTRESPSGPAARGNHAAALHFGDVAGLGRTGSGRGRRASPGVNLGPILADIGQRRRPTPGVGRHDAVFMPLGPS